MKLSNKTPKKIANDRYSRKLSSKQRKKGFIDVVRKKPWKARKLPFFVAVVAPQIINFYKPQHFEESNAFIQDLQEKIRNAHKNGNQVIKIIFRNTQFITAAAAINLFAETSRSIKAYPGLSYSVVPAQKVRIEGKKSVSLVDAVLNRLGFFELLGIKKKNYAEVETVRCWNQANGTVADGRLAGKIIKEIENLGVEPGMLYRSSVEAISNAVEHGYDPKINSSISITDKTWWMFAAVFDEKLTILVSDLGHGIPNTLERTQDASVLKEIWTMLGIKATKDCELIHASTLVKQTQTRLTNRGKGGKDLTTLVDHYPKSSLTIFSNRGVYRYKGKRTLTKGVSYDNKTPINGTIVEWTIPLGLKDK